eukprot:1055443-Amphidinium_carterae.1
MATTESDSFSPLQTFDPCFGCIGVTEFVALFGKAKDEPALPTRFRTVLYLDVFSWVDAAKQQRREQGIMVCISIAAEHWQHCPRKVTR